MGFQKEIGWEQGYGEAMDKVIEAALPDATSQRPRVG